MTCVTLSSADAAAPVAVSVAFSARMTVSVGVPAMAEFAAMSTLGGYVMGLSGGILISLPALLLGGESLTMLVFAAVGVSGGLLRDLAPELA